MMITKKKLLFKYMNVTNVFEKAEQMFLWFKRGHVQ